jgi:C_GCAxxG_C_C family probable redox protein
MPRSEDAVQNLGCGYSCSESILAAYCGAYGLDRDTAIRLASGFGGGMGLMGEVCGAVSASFMALGLHFGESDLSKADARGKTYEAVGEFANSFEERHGSILCREIMSRQGVSVPQEWGKAREMGILRSLCPRIVEDCADILEQMIK